MFTHLHTHSHFSFGLGASSPEALAQAAAEHGFRALACTDTNGVYGAVEFQGACDAISVRSILGAHLVELLLQKEHDVVVLDSFVTSQPSSLDRLIAHPRLEVIR